MKYEKEAKNIIEACRIVETEDTNQASELIPRVAKMIEDIVSAECIDCSMEQIEREDHAEPSFEKQDMD